MGKRWAKKEDVEVDTLSEWIKSIVDVLKRRIRRLKHSVNTRHESIFSDPDVVRELSRLHENFVIVPADKASNNYTFVCKRHYVSILSEELGLNSLPGNPTYNLTDLSASEVLDNHKSVLTSFGIETSDDELDLPYIYWIPKMHKNPYKHRFIAGSSKCSTKPLSILLTKLLTHIKQGLQKYCETAYSRSGINQMWILKNSKELLEHLKSPTLNRVTSIKSFDFSTLYTTIPHHIFPRQGLNHATLLQPLPFPLHNSWVDPHFMPPFEKGGHIALHLSVGRSVCMSVCRYPLTLCN